VAGEYRAQLYPFCDELKRVAVEIADDASVQIGPQGLADPKIIALAILCRTRSNFGGAVTLVKASRVVEARVLAHCCFENMFLGGRLGRGRAALRQTHAGRRGREQAAQSETGAQHGSVDEPIVRRARTADGLCGGYEAEAKGQNADAESGL